MTLSEPPDLATASIADAEAPVTVISNFEVNSPFARIRTPSLIRRTSPLSTRDCSVIGFFASIFFASTNFCIKPRFTTA